jgi:CheY-like chemotaxis protein/anti-sigma regulatory factor (Ser/Thr protein kinase)
VWLQGDFARLAQVVSNLLHNAAKYSEDGGRIQLELSVEDGQAQIVVRDNGIGIDATLLPRIFDLFQQGSRSLDRMQGGPGRGLHAGARLVELHGGVVDARATAGKGAEFRVTSLHQRRAGGEGVQRAGRADAGARAAASSSSTTTRTPPRASRTYLQLEGHEVKTVGGRHAGAWPACRCSPPQIVVLDIGLPVLSGYEVARRMRQMSVTRDALLIALTGYGPEGRQLRAKEAGFDRHFVKPPTHACWST